MYTCIAKQKFYTTSYTHFPLLLLAMLVPQTPPFLVVLLQYTTASTVLSAGSIRQQFSSTVNIGLSLFSFGFLQEVGDYLMVEGSDPPDIQLVHGGYLFLASEAGQEILQQNYETQRSVCQSVCLFVCILTKVTHPSKG